MGSVEYMGYNINQETKSSPSLRNKYFFIDTACFIIHLVWMLLFLYEEIYLMGLLNSISCIIYLYLYYAICRGNITRIVTVIYAEVLTHTIAALLCLGFRGGFDLYILVFIPIMFFFSFVYDDGKENLSMGGVLAGIVYVILRVVMFFYKPQYAFSDTHLELAVTVFNSFMCIFVLLTITFLTCNEINQARYELEEKNKKLTFLSSHDPLTKLLNRRSMEEIIDEVEQEKHNKSPNAVAFFDVDNFKKFNDQYGHKCGDEVLTKVAEIISLSVGFTNKNTQTKNYICRWGGEEIIILFHGYEKEEVIHKVNRIKTSIGNYHIHLGGEQLSISVTCGIAFGMGDKDLRDLINEADSYMLKGKRSGKNCIVHI